MPMAHHVNAIRQLLIKKTHLAKTAKVRSLSPEKSTSCKSSNPGHPDSDNKKRTLQKQQKCDRHNHLPSSD